MVQDYRQEQKQREIRSDLRAYRVWEACRGIAIGLGAKGEQMKPGDVFPSLRALEVSNDGVASIDDEEDIAMSSFSELRRGYRA